MNRSSRIAERLAVKRSYQSKPLLRRSQTLESLLATVATVVVIVGAVASKIGLALNNRTIGIVMLVVCAIAFCCFVATTLLICVVTLTGPVYKPQLDFSSGELETYGRWDKFAAIAIAMLVLFAAAYVLYRNWPFS